MVLFLQNSSSKKLLMEIAILFVINASGIQNYSCCLYQKKIKITRFAFLLYNSKKFVHQKRYKNSYIAVFFSHSD